MKKASKQNKKLYAAIVMVALLCSTSIGLFITSPIVSAQQAKTCAEGQVGTLEVPCAPPKDSISKEDPALKGGSSGTNIIGDYVNPFIRLMTAIVGVVIVLSVVIAGIQYSAAGGDPSGVASAKKRIT